MVGYWDEKDRQVICVPRMKEKMARRLDVECAGGLDGRGINFEEREQADDEGKEGKIRD